MKQTTTSIIIISILAACGISLTGCTTYYYQQDKTINQCKQDRQQCVVELRKYSTLQQFGDYELKFMENCMKQKGYMLITKDKLPIKVRREEPEESLHWRLHGVAGTVEQP